MTSIDDNPPKKVFIVPYRDREPHKLVFTRVNALYFRRFKLSYSISTSTRSQTI